MEGRGRKQNEGLERLLRRRPSSRQVKPITATSLPKNTASAGKVLIVKFY